MKHSLQITTTLGLALCLNGCASLAPKYNQPAAPVPANWASNSAANTPAATPAEKAVADIPWQEFFIDPQLRKVITLALANNRDLRIALLTIQRYQALYQIKESDLLPKLNANASVAYQRTPEDFSGKGQAVTSHPYSAGLGISAYELDMFGRVKSLKDQALEQYLGTEQAKRSVQISLVSQVAAAYLTLAADRERLKLARETLTNQQSALQITKDRFAAGIANALALSQAQASVESARVDIARVTSVVAQDENALNLLVGATLPTELLPASLSETVTGLKSVSPGTPSDVLLHRPDILQAENNLKGLNANIGAARANMFPRISLVSSVGFGSSELSGLFKSGAFAWSIMPSISLPIFDGGSNKANLKVAEVDRTIAIAQYEKAIQTAFREVSDTLAQLNTIEEQQTAQQALTDTTAESYRLSQARYDKGVDAYLAVLDSQRSLYAAQQNLISVRFTKLANMVTLYKVLGGGSK
ncbi:MAG: efflux transporter outer membrane subunit [Geobacter sp.]|nr:efflux transporter outer membrane subunit [Geobacter sp.]